MKLGILGTGKIVMEMLRFVYELNFEKIILLGTERSKERTEALAAQYHLDGCYYDYDELLATDVDTIYVALPNSLHYDFARRALESGRHVIIEKPITSNVRELRDLIALAKTQNCMIFEAMNVHYLPALRSIKEDLSKLGNIRIVNANYSQYSSRYDAFKEGTILPAFDYHKSGGALMDINVYNVHTILALFGVPGAVKYYPNIRQKIDVSGILVYDYDDFKGVSIGAKDCAAPAILEIQGDRGELRANSACNRLFGYTLTEYGREPVEKNFEEGRHRMYYEFAEFIRMIDERDFEEQEHMLEISLAASQLMEKARIEQGIVFDADHCI